MAIISSFDTTQLQGLVTALSAKVNALTKPASDSQNATLIQKGNEAQVALVALNAYITSIT